MLVATSEIDINGVKVTKLASKILAKQAGLSLDALSHCTCPLVATSSWISFHKDDNSLLTEIGQGLWLSSIEGKERVTYMIS